MPFPCYAISMGRCKFQTTTKQHNDMTDKPNLAMTPHYHEDYDRREFEPLTGEALALEMQSMKEEADEADRRARLDPTSLYNSLRNDTRTREQVRKEETDNHMRKFR